MSHLKNNDLSRGQIFTAISPSTSGGYKYSSQSLLLTSPLPTYSLGLSNSSKPLTHLLYKVILFCFHNIAPSTISLNLAMSFRKMCFKYLTPLSSHAKFPRECISSSFWLFFISGIQLFGFCPCLPLKIEMKMEAMVVVWWWDKFLNPQTNTFNYGIFVKLGYLAWCYFRHVFSFKYSWTHKYFVKNICFIICAYEKNIKFVEEKLAN